MTCRSIHVRRLVFMVLAGLAAVTALGFWWDANGRVATVEEGRLYRSRSMSPARMVETATRLGVRTVVDLRNTEADAEAEAEALAAVGIRHVHLPSTQVPETELVDRFLDLVADESARPVLVHCRHGVGRTGVFSAIYRIEHHGWSTGRATLEAWVMAGGGSFAPFSEKRAFLSHYTPRAARQPTPSPGTAEPGVILRSR